MFLFKENCWSLETFQDNSRAVHYVYPKTLMAWKNRAISILPLRWIFTSSQSLCSEASETLRGRKSQKLNEADMASQMTCSSNGLDNNFLFFCSFRFLPLAFVSEKNVRPTSIGLKEVLFSSGWFWWTNSFRYSTISIIDKSWGSLMTTNGLLNSSFSWRSCSGEK